MGALYAAVARATITPPVGTFLMGYASRDKGSVSLHDDLVATALVMSDGQTKVALLCCDLIFLHPTTVTRVRKVVAERADVPPGHVMICCSHTHSGPVTYVGAAGESGRHSQAYPVDWEQRRAYLNNLVYLLAGAVVEASHALRPVAWGIGRGEVTIGHNRRQVLPDGRVVLGVNPRGAVDPELLLLRLDAVQGDAADGPSPGSTRPLAVLANYACHAVCLSSNSYAISADWPGVTRRVAEGATGAHVAFVQGAGADINPLGGPQDRFDNARRLGTAVAEELARVHQGISLRRDAELAVARRLLWLPLFGPSDREGGPVQPFEALAAQTIGLPTDEVRAFLEQRFPWAADVIQVGPGGHAGGLEGGQWHARAEVQAIRLSDWVLVAVSAEPFVEIGLAVKSQSPAAMTMFGGYTNGSMGYLPTLAAYENGGYEVNTAHVYYRLPAPPAPSCAEQVNSAALGLIAELLDQGPG